MKIKLLVYSIFIFQIVQIILYANDIWKAFVVNFGDFTAIESSKTIWLSICVFGSMGAFHLCTRSLNPALKRAFPTSGLCCSIILRLAHPCCIKQMAPNYLYNAGMCIRLKLNDHR